MIIRNTIQINELLDILIKIHSIKYTQYTSWKVQLDHKCI